MADKDAAMHSGVIARTIVLDKLVKTYLAGHGGAVVVNIACGLDTRCYRMSGYSHWYNLDLPETIAVREKLLPESRKISQIAMSAMDDWGGEIKETSTDVLVIIEGLTMYLSESDVKCIFDVIAARFDRVTVFVETVVLLSHKKADSYIHIDVEFGEGEGKIPVDSIAKRAEAYKPKEKVTYKMIKEYIEAKYGFKVHTAYIAEVKRDLGLPMYDAPNAVEELKQPRKHPTPEKVEAIKDALRYFAVI